MKTLNLGILAHVDAGKTSLTERLLFEAGIIQQLGAVDTGNTQMDTMDIERQRGITIQASVVSFPIGSFDKINLIDTPGHADFIAEVERSLRVLDAAILVISAVEGIQPQTRVLMQCLKKLKKPTLVFINKVDRQGAQPTEIIRSINASLDIVAFPMVHVSHSGTKDATVQHFYTSQQAEYRQHLLDTLAEGDDPFLLKCIETDFSVEKDDFILQIQKQTAAAAFFPVYCGSAMTGVGVDKLLFGIGHILPFKQQSVSESNAGEIFKIEHHANHSKDYFINLTSGNLRNRQTITLYCNDNSAEPFAQKITKLQVFENGKVMPANMAEAGSIVIVNGLTDASIGDTLSPNNHKHNDTFSRPKLQTVISPINPTDRPQLVYALQIFSEQDPLISFRLNENELVIDLYGEIQKEVITQRLHDEFQIDVIFSPSKVICIERPIGKGEAINLMDLHNPPLEFYATLGFRIEPGLEDSGIKIDMHTKSGSIPKGYLSVVRESMLTFLKKGLYGWPVTDCLITLTHAGVCPLSIAPHFRQLTPILMQQALKNSGTQVCEPYSSFEIELPSGLLNAVLIELGNIHAVIQQIKDDNKKVTIMGELRSKYLHLFESQLPGLTNGRAVFFATQVGYRPIQ